MNSPIETVSLFSSRLALPIQDRSSALVWIVARTVLLALTVFVANATAQDNAFPAAASVLQPQAYASLQPVPRGRAFQVAIVAKISPGFHINAHVPSEDYLIPTKVSADLSPGVFLVETTYPRGVMRAFRFSKTPLRVYEEFFHGSDEIAREWLRADRPTKNQPNGGLPSL